MVTDMDMDMVTGMFTGMVTGRVTGMVQVTGMVMEMKVITLRTK